MLKHESQMSQDGHPRKVSLEIRARALVGITQSLSRQALGSAGRYAGFLASGRNGRGSVFHVTEFEGEPASSTD